MKANGKPSIPELIRDKPRIQKALRDAVQDTLRTHKLLGQPIVGWRDGKVVWIPPEEIELLPDDTENKTTA
jgi:hypothetical protein